MTAPEARGFVRLLAEQLALPSGGSGRLLGAAMDIVNRRPTRLAIDLLDPKPGERVLDAGCGTGAGLAAVLRRAPCRVAGLDASPTMLQVAKGRLGKDVELTCGRLEDLPFAAASFDAALALNVLYFCDRGGRMIANLRSVLKPGGRLVGYVTHRESMANWRFVAAGLHRLFDEREFAEAFLAGGFARDRICVHAVMVTRSVKGLLVQAER